MEQCLRAFAAGQQAGEFSVTYSDMHGLWGGTTVSLAGSGAYERAERPAGAREPAVTRTTLGATELRQVVALLLEIRAWEQQAPALDRPLVPDESFANLELRCGGAVARVFEPANDLARLGRLVRVRDLLRALGGEAP